MFLDFSVLGFVYTLRIISSPFFRISFWVVLLFVRAKWRNLCELTSFAIISIVRVAQKKSLYFHDVSFGNYFVRYFGVHWKSHTFDGVFNTIDVTATYDSFAFFTPLPLLTWMLNNVHRHENCIFGIFPLQLLVKFSNEDDSSIEDVIIFHFGPYIVLLSKFWETVRLKIRYCVVFFPGQLKPWALYLNNLNYLKF